MFNLDTLKCCVCKQVPIDVVDSKCCASLFCWECGTSVDTCPNCHAKMDWAGLSSNPALQKILDHLEVKCRFEGCQTQVLSMLHKEHESQCMFKPTVCPNSALCGIILTKDLQKHMDEECSERSMACPYSCGKSFKLSVMLDHIKFSCDETEADCVNGCGKKLKRRDTPNHSAVECPFAPIACEFLPYGCKHAILRSHMKDHLDSTIHEHMNMLTRALKVQELEITTLKDKMNQRPYCITNLGECIEQAKASAIRIGNEYRHVPFEVCNFFNQQSTILPKVANTLKQVRQTYSCQDFLSLIFLIFLFGFIVPHFFSKLTLVFAVLNMSVGIYQGNANKVTKWANYGVASFLGICHCLLFSIVALSIGIALKMFCIRRNITLRGLCNFFCCN